MIGGNGLRDIIGGLGNQNNFHRLRIGIAHRGDAKLVSNYVPWQKTPSAEQEKSNLRLLLLSKSPI